MSFSAQPSFDLRRLLALPAFVLVLVVAHAALAAESDNRINPDGSLGGDAVYCVDAAMNPTSDPADAGIRLLDALGESLFYVSPEQIAAVPHHPYANTLIPQGSGSYGPVYLERLTNGQFRLIGKDDQGRISSVTWTDCAQVAPITSNQNGDSSSPSAILAACVAAAGEPNASRCHEIADILAPVCAAEALDARTCVSQHFL